MNEYSRDALYHYGTIGMKWGVRRFQPYPSDYHGDGKFVGKQQKQNFKVLKKQLKVLSLEPAEDTKALEIQT